jgi:MFS family permease
VFDTRAFKELVVLNQKRQENESHSSKPINRSPVLQALRKYPQRIARTAGAFLSIQVTFYILIAFLLAYGVTSAGMSRDDMLVAVLIASALMVPTQFLFSAYSDRHGRRGIFMLGAVLTAIWAFVVFPLVDTGNFGLIVLAITVGLLFLGMMYGPQAAFFTELFSTEVRYSGASLGYQAGAILGGAFAPVIAVGLWTKFGIVWGPYIIPRKSRPTVMANTINPKLPVSTKGNTTNAHMAVNTAPNINIPRRPCRSE